MLKGWKNDQNLISTHFLSLWTSFYAFKEFLSCCLKPFEPKGREFASWKAWKHGSSLTSNNSWSKAFQGFCAPCFWKRRHRAFQKAPICGALKLPRARKCVWKLNKMKKKVKNSMLREKHCGVKGLKKPDNNAQRLKERPKSYFHSFCELLGQFLCFQRIFVMLLNPLSPKDAN